MGFGFSFGHKLSVQLHRKQKRTMAMVFFHINDEALILYAFWLKYKGF